MQTITKRGILIGVIVAVVTWLSEMSAPAGRVSTFPDVMSLLTLVVCMAFTLRARLGPSATTNDVFRAASLLGISAGAVVGVSTGLRGAVRWSHVDVVMVVVAIVVSLVAVLLVTHVVALIAYGMRRRGQRVGA